MNYEQHDGELGLNLGIDFYPGPFTKNRVAGPFVMEGDFTSSAGTEGNFNGGGRAEGKISLCDVGTCINYALGANTSATLGAKAALSIKAYECSGVDISGGGKVGGTIGASIDMGGRAGCSAACDYGNGSIGSLTLNLS